MGTDKRERQKQARRERLEAEARAYRQSATRRRIVLFAGLFIVVAVGLYTFTGDDGSEETVDATASTTTSGADEGAETDEIAGTPPTTVAAGEPVEPECPPEDGAAEPTHQFTGPFSGCLEEGVDYRARFVTTKGDVVVDLREDEMPNTVGNFVALARHHYYDGTDLFRTDPSIDIIQGGSPHTQDASDPGPGYRIEDEPKDQFDAQGTKGPFTYQPGQLMMARSAGPDSSGAQFFFSTGPNVAGLDGQGTYLLFGDVIEGLDVLEGIMELHQPGESLGGRPSEYVIVEEVEILEA